jgi:ABC-type nitrate/sulfonate/bicarbonate transport system substrate-binding protein
MPESRFSSLDCPAIAGQLDQAQATRKHAAQAKRGSWKVIVPIAIGVRYFNASHVENEAEKREAHLLQEQQAKGCTQASGAAENTSSIDPNKMTPISVISFPSPHDWPIWVAQEQGYFERNAIAVSLTPTADSKFQLAGLIDGKFDIAMTGIDNVIAYMEGQGEAPTQATPDIFAFMGASNQGFLRLVTLPEVKSFTDLKGKQLSVDALTTGYAFVLRKVLEEGGLTSSDVEFVSVGGLRQRYQALMEKKQAGTLLISPMHAAAQQRGFNILANAEDVLGHYQASVGAARRDWARNNEAALAGYIRAYMDAVAWLRNPANEAQAVAILSKNMPGMTEPMAAQAYEVLLNSDNGLDPRAQLDIEGIETVLALRSEYAEPRKYLAEAGKYYDLHYHEEAIGLERQLPRSSRRN